MPTLLDYLQITGANWSDVGWSMGRQYGCMTGPRAAV